MVVFSRNAWENHTVPQKAAAPVINASEYSLSNEADFQALISELNVQLLSFFHGSRCSKCGRHSEKKCGKNI